MIETGKFLVHVQNNLQEILYINHCGYILLQLGRLQTIQKKTLNQQAKKILL